MKHILHLIVLIICTITLAGCSKAGSVIETRQVSPPDPGMSAQSTEWISEEEPALQPDGGETDSRQDEQSPDDTLLPHESAADSYEETAESSASSSDSSGTDWLTIADIKCKDVTALIASYTSSMDSLRIDELRYQYNNRYFHHENGFVTYDDPDYECLSGIDVSSFQGKIDWEAVREQGISFAFIRLGYRGYSEGVLNEDEMYRQNLEGARSAGLLVGAYFFSQAVNEEEAAEEAAFALQLLDGFALDLPLVFDAEYIRDDEARTDSVYLSQFTKNALAFCEKANSAGYEACFYSNLIWELLIYDLGELMDYPIWFAGYDAVPKTPYTFTFWQYSESGSVAGIEGDVDLDIWIRKK